MEPSLEDESTKKALGAAADTAGKPSEEGLPMKSSPYTQSKDTEDYKVKGYGTGGHQQPVEGRGAGGTDAPTPSGGADPVTSKHDQKIDEINRKGVP